MNFGIHYRFFENFEKAFGKFFPAFELFSKLEIQIVIKKFFGSVLKL